MTRQRWYLVGAFGLTLILPLPLILLLNYGLVETPANLLIYDLGVIAYVWWLEDVYLATRPKWVERLLGLPGSYFIHGLLGILALLLATLHKFNAFSMFPLIKETGNYAWYIMLFVVGSAVIFLSGWLTDRSRLFARFKRFCERHLIKHQLSVWIHRLVFVAIILVWFHVQLIPRIGNIFWFNVLFDLYTLGALGAYGIQKFRQKLGPTDAIVVANEDLGPKLQQVTLKLMEPHKKYRAGDFYFLAFKEKVWGERHPFSVASAPSEKSDEVIFMIHKTGDFTQKITQVKQGTKVSLEGPFGLFERYVKSAKGPVILYGLGTGVAPLFSLALEYATQKPLRLIWSTNGQEPAGYYQEMLERLKEMDVKLDVKKHRFTLAELKQKLTDSEREQGLVIVVGSAPVVLQVQKTLKELGFSEKQILDERLTM